MESDLADPSGPRNAPAGSQSVRSYLPAIGVAPICPARPRQVFRSGYQSHLSLECFHAISQDQMITSLGLV